MSDDQTLHSQNVQRVTEEIVEAVTNRSGPFGDSSWDENGGESTKSAFTDAVLNIFTVEAEARAGREQQVNKKTEAYLRDLGETLETS